jgi:hypothetical protein
MTEGIQLTVVDTGLCDWDKRQEACVKERTLYADLTDHTFG